MKQTAIEWLSEQIINAKYTYKLRDDLENFLLEKAKEMEKQQIIDAYNESELTQLRAENERLKAALEQISRPIKFMKDNLEDGYKLDATHAFELSNDPYYLKNIANKALESLTHKER